ncbi:MAG TPA: hypothetical protein ENK18_19175 [Deltaproteobacteria bacterium]|nr:hypothetical protein [Deltaproteobacteria bacterium]
MLVRELTAQAKIELEERNFQREALSEAELGELVDLAGGVAAVISPRNAAVKAAGWSKDPPDRDTFVAAAAGDNKMIRRPILVVGSTVVVGNDEAGIRAALASIS